MPYLSNFTYFANTSYLGKINPDLTFDICSWNNFLVIDKSFCSNKLIKNWFILSDTKLIVSLLTHYNPLPSYFGFAPKL